MLLKLWLAEPRIGAGEERVVIFRADTETRVRIELEMGDFGVEVA
jgi:hypothetical protein